MNDNLPPLPEPSHRCENADEATHFTKLQMLEYGKLCRQQALEEAAKAIEDVEPQINRVGYAAFIRNMK